MAQQGGLRLPEAGYARVRIVRPHLRILAVFLVAAAGAQADTIVLKSGRRISATEVHEEGDRVVYEISAGRLSLPKSIVDHVERGPFASFASDGAAGNAATVAATMVATPPPVASDNTFEDITKGVIPGGFIDRNYLFKLDSEAQGGGKLAIERMAFGHHLAAQFELRKGDMDQAVSQYQRALTFAPDHVGLLLNLSAVLIRESQFSQAIDSLERAKRVAPKDFYAAKFLGMAYYGANKIDQAVEEWKRALQLRSDPDIQQELEEVQRRQREEADYREGRSAHFQVRYSGAAAPASLVSDILRTLEGQFSAIESALNYTPREPIGVVLYTNQAYTDVTGAPDWTGAVTDTMYSHISIATQGLAGLNSDLSRKLKHELTHAFITQKTRNRCPTWMQEGMAQWMEGERAGKHAGAFVALYDQRKMIIPLADLEGSWMGFSDDQARLAYAWAVSVIEYIVSTDGLGDIDRILDHMASGSSEEAVKSVLRMDYPELEESTIKYLRKTYIR